MKKLMTLLVLAGVSGLVGAKLPPLSDEAKAKAAEAAAKAAYADKVGAYKLCEVQNKLAARYLAEAGKSVQPAPTPACAEPGPFSYTPAAKPIEAAGAHSPAATATGPPSTTVPQAASTPAK